METEFRVGDVVALKRVDCGNGVVTRVEYGRVWALYDGDSTESWAGPDSLTLVSRAPQVEKPEPGWLGAARAELPSSDWAIDQWRPGEKVVGCDRLITVSYKGRLVSNEWCALMFAAAKNDRDALRSHVQHYAKSLGLPDPYAKPEPRRHWFQVGDRVSYGQVEGVVHDVRGDYVTAICDCCDEPTSRRAECFTLITPATPVTVQDGAAVLPEPTTDPPVPHCAECGEELSMLGAALCGDCCSEYTPGGCRASHDSRCDLCMAILAPANPQRMPDFGALNELGFPRMPFRGASTNVTIIDEADDFHITRLNIGGTLLYEAVRDEKPLDAFLAAREAQPEPKPELQPGDLVSAWLQSESEAPRRCTGIMVRREGDRFLVVRVRTEHLLCFRAGAEVVTRKEVL